MDNGPQGVDHRMAIRPAVPGCWRGGWRERMSKPKLKHGVVWFGRPANLELGFHAEGFFGLFDAGDLWLEYGRI